MSNDNSWFKLYRKITQSPVFDNPNLLKMWIWILCKATHKERIQIVGLQEIHLKKGEFVFGRKAAAEALNMTESNSYKLLKTLEKMKMISVISNNKFSVVSVENWDFFQDGVTTEEQQSNNKVTTKEQQSNTNKNVKNVKNVKKKDIGAFAPPTLDEVRSYCLERKSSVDPERFIDFYSSKGWMVGKNKMKDWKSALRGWESREQKPTSTASPQKKQNRFVNFEQRKWDFDAIEQFERNRK